MTVLSDAVPAPQITAPEIARLHEAADHLEAFERILAEMEASIRAAAEREEAWLAEHMTEEERMVLHGDFEAFAYVLGAVEPPEKLARMFHRLADRCRPAERTS